MLEKSKEEFHSAGLVKEEIQEEIRNVENYEEDVKEAYLIFKRNEASFEIVVLGQRHSANLVHDAQLE